MNSKLNFVRQQGFADVSSEECSYLYNALMWQPRVIGILVLAGLAFQSAPFFFAMGAVLWWNAILPALNPFDAAYNLAVKPKEAPPLPWALPPRRFAQAEAGSVMLAIGLALHYEVNPLAYALQGLVFASLAAVIFGRFCQGSYLFFLFTGQSSLANRTLPWSP